MGASDRRRSRASFLLVIIGAIMLAAVMGCSGDNGELIDQETCRANMNVLSTDIIVYHSIHGRWPEDLAEAEAYARRREPLVCPSSGECYEYDLSDSGYVVSCPCGLHGFVSMGRPNWVVGGTESSTP
ncbi:hypothetical protein JW921_04365 [Candidatus Fermentibacterales bacterium]|nr:hypothetical protein [Candidatus Fermentibacterales bacterium]